MKFHSPTSSRSQKKRFRSSPSFSQTTRVCAWDGWRANCGQLMEVSSKLDPTISEHPEERKYQSGVASICEILAMEIFKQQLLCGCSSPIHEKTSWVTRCELTTRSENARRPRGAGPLLLLLLLLLLFVWLVVWLVVVMIVEQPKNELLQRTVGAPMRWLKRAK